MLKFFFWILLLANAALFAYRQGHLEAFMPSGREPARMMNQLNADKVKVVPAPAPAAIPSATPAPAPAEQRAPEPAAQPTAPVAEAVEKKPAGSLCVEVGNFPPADAKRFESRLASLTLEERVRQRTIQEVLSYIVYIPPQGGKEAADRKVEELRRLGLQDFYVIQDESNLRWAISLGVFKAEEGARAHLVELTRKGVRSARIGPHSMSSPTVAFQLRGLDLDTKAQVEKIKEEFPRQALRAC